MTGNKPAGEKEFYTISNADIYGKVIELEKQMARIVTIFAFVAFIISPAIGVLVSRMFS